MNENTHPGFGGKTTPQASCGILLLATRNTVTIALYSNLRTRIYNWAVLLQNNIGVKLFFSNAQLFTLHFSNWRNRKAVHKKYLKVSFWKKTITHHELEASRVSLCCYGENYPLWQSDAAHLLITWLPLAKLGTVPLYHWQKLRHHFVVTFAFDRNAFLPATY